MSKKISAKQFGEALAILIESLIGPGEAAEEEETPKAKKSAKEETKPAAKKGKKEEKEEEEEEESEEEEEEEEDEELDPDQLLKDIKKGDLKALQALAKKLNTEYETEINAAEKNVDKLRKALTAAVNELTEEDDEDEKEDEDDEEEEEEKPAKKKGKK